ncbi:alkaline phosphatase D family protein [Streptomyces sp. KK5PA1]|uniref:Alkaline phosphatase D family protein n=1 Tax=Actinacidiphila acididurans TaxID=2784346 RepID=A0ABS2TL50_9ACTN|nr:alkaline phosphatase D family protein [Actinacidiphila acididurans]
MDPPGLEATGPDHKVTNDYKGGIATASQRTRAGFTYQAWWESMPTRLAKPTGSSMKVCWRFPVGDLRQIDMLDSRQYRTADNDPVISRLGNEQEAWLIDGINQYGARWNVIAQGQQLGDIPRLQPHPEPHLRRVLRARVPAGDPDRRHELDHRPGRPARGAERRQPDRGHGVHRHVDHVDR